MIGHAIKALVHAARPNLPVVTPYLLETSQPMAAYFQTQGLSLAKFLCLGLKSDLDMARFDPASIIKAALASQTGKPVVTSNQACAWELTHHT